MINLPPDSTLDINYVRAIQIRRMRSKIPLRLLAYSLRINEDFLRSIVGIQPHLKGELK